jgi:hypothetical protein
MGVVTGLAWRSRRQSAGAPTHPLLERAAECRFRLVAHRARHRLHGAAFDEETRRELHAPQYEVLDWRMADHLGKPFRQHRPGDPHRSREPFDGPWLDRLSVERRQGLPMIRSPASHPEVSGNVSRYWGMVSASHE